jgi:CBS domain-containing protein
MAAGTGGHRTEEAPMKRWLYVHRTVDLGDREIERRFAQLRELLQEATGSELAPPAGDGSFLLEIPGPTLGKEIGKQVRFHTGPARRSGHRLILPVGWHAAPAAALFPVFDGSLEVEPLDARRSQVTLVGTAAPPLGPLGKALDSTLLHTVAERTAARLLRSLCRELETATMYPRATPAAVDPTGKVSLYVADVMTRNPLVVDEETSVRTAALLLHHGGITGLPVVDREGTLVGVLSEADLMPHVASQRSSIGRKAGAERRRRGASTAGSLCTRPARCTSPDARLAAATREMLDRDISRLVVLDTGRIVGILTRHDVLNMMFRTDASLRRAVDTVLGEHRADDLEIDVEAGHVHLDGEVEFRSVAEQLPGLVAAIDGVVSVRSEGLSWHVDDVGSLQSLQPMPGI